MPPRDNTRRSTGRPGNPTPISAPSLLWTALLALVALPACVPPNLATNQANHREADLSLSVRNENPMDVRVYIVRGSLEYRLGIVTTFHTEYLRVPPLVFQSPGTLRIKAVPVGGGPAYLTEPILTGTIQRIDIRLANPFAHSVIFVR